MKWHTRKTEYVKYVPFQNTSPLSYMSRFERQRGTRRDCAKPSVGLYAFTRLLAPSVECNNVRSPIIFFFKKKEVTYTKTWYLPKINSLLAQPTLRHPPIQTPSIDNQTSELLNAQAQVSEPHSAAPHHHHQQQAVPALLPSPSRSPAHTGSASCPVHARPGLRYSRRAAGA